MAGRIVVGVDGSEGAALALRWALEEARLRDASVAVVHAWHIPPMITADPTGMAMGALDPKQYEEAARLELNRSIDHAGPVPGGVHIESIVANGGAAETLLDTAIGADLLVVGSRGRGGFARLLLGSVSQQCAHHAPCAVVIVPTSDHSAHN